MVRCFFSQQFAYFKVVRDTQNITVGAGIGIVGKMVGQGLDGHGAVEACVVAKIDDTHTPAPELAVDPVRPQLRQWCRQGLEHTRGRVCFPQIRLKRGQVSRKRPLVSRDARGSFPPTPVPKTAGSVENRPVPYPNGWSMATDCFVKNFGPSSVM